MPNKRTAMTYLELKKLHREKSDKYVDNYGFFAFNQTQLSEGLAKLNIPKEEGEKHIYKMFGGLFMLKDKAHGFLDLLEENARELHSMMRQESFALNALSYELSNHEYCYTYDSTDTIQSLSYTVEEFERDDHLMKCLRIAIKNYYESNPN